MEHHAHTYVLPGGRSPPGHDDATRRPRHRRTHNAPDSDFQTVGEIFSPASNPERKKAFDIRTVMRAVADQDQTTLERWAGMADADTSVVMDAHVGGWPVCLLGIESGRSAAARVPAHRRAGRLHRGHAVPDVVEEGGTGDQRGQREPSAGRARQPVGLRRVAGLVRNLQLEYGAEIGRAVASFRGRSSSW